MTDDQWMAMALLQAQNGVGKTAPNPPVGAVLVKNEQLLASGWHQKAGQPHAEVEAIRAAHLLHGPESTKGATAYITLEPCSTTGRTPACTSGLIEAGISRVVYACQDPNHNHAGAADAILDKAGIQVTSGILRDECEEILRPFTKVQRTGIPWIIWKCAMSLDGRITRPPGEGQWLSNKESLADVQKLRSQVDAILTSGETVRNDRPSLTIRIPELLQGRDQPWRIVLSKKPESLPKDAPLFTDESKDRTLVLDSTDLTLTLKQLAKDHGILSVMLEAGGNLSAAMLHASFVDEAVIYYAPLLCGATLSAVAGESFPNSIKLDNPSWQTLGNNLRLRALISK
jgi:diaminohydroxyphosphoribosylaminopyrimidine deaminase / 5-amino-6-(5-phosphoribosylamino)uracil reductase